MFRTKWLKLAQMVQDNLDGPKVVQKYHLKIFEILFCNPRFKKDKKQQ